MKLKEYQKQAQTTCLETCRNVGYMLHNLIGEVGETAEKIVKSCGFEIDDNIIARDLEIFKHIAQHYGNTAKKIRHNTEPIYLDNAYDFHSVLLSARESEFEEIKKELGDILWQLSGLCSVLDIDLEEVAEMNLAKLASRKERGVIDGNGDNR